MDQNCNNETQEYDAEFLKELLLHTDKMYYQRITIFFAIEAILISFAGALWNIKILVHLICVLGLASTIALMHVISRLRNGLNWLVKNYKKKNETYKCYCEIKKPKDSLLEKILIKWDSFYGFFFKEEPVINTVLPSAGIFEMFFPVLFLILWLAMLVASLFSAL